MTAEKHALNPIVVAVTARVRARSHASRAAYLERIRAQRAQSVSRQHLSCANLAHLFAASSDAEKGALRQMQWPNVAIVSAYNDLLSAHQPLQYYPVLIKDAAREANATAQFAGGVPAMCDGITQGRPGMELSLFSRDVIALSSAVALTHDGFDAVVMMGVCDKIVPGLLMAALQFGALPTVFVSAGPMPSGLPNSEKAKVRREFAQGKVDREALLDAEAKSYHSPGTCTFYGTANSNQMLLEAMGLMLPGSAFVAPHTALRDALTRESTRVVIERSHVRNNDLPIGEMIDERSIINAIITLLATGGSTNHTIHLIAIANAAGIRINWDDFDELSGVVPLLARVYPNGEADVNRFHELGGTSFVIKELLAGGLLHGDVETILGSGLERYCQRAELVDGHLTYVDLPNESDHTVLRGIREPFKPEGGLKVLRGNLGRAVIKTSAMKPEHFVIEAPVRIFETQAQLTEAFKAGELNRDFVAVLRFQGPKANGMPELHELTPALSSLLNQGYQVALVTDGRMSGASGPVPAAIHATPEALSGGPLAKLRDGDVVRLDATKGTLQALVETSEWEAREALLPSLPPAHGFGREMFEVFRKSVSDAERGAIVAG
jgi:phosphogluconate dehydratase